MMSTMMSSEASELVQSVWDGLITAQFELICFFSAMLMYAVLMRMRVPTKHALYKKKAKIMEEPASPSSGDANKKTSTKDNRKATSPRTASHDIAKHVMMIRKAGSENNLKSAMSIFESLKATGVEMNAIIYNTVLDACVKCRDLKAATSWMERAKQDGFVDVVSYNIFMKAHLLNHDLDKARSILREMKQAGMQPNKVTFNELINAAVAHGSAKDAVWDVVKEMKEMGMAPNQVTCSILLKNLNARSSEVEISNVMDLITSIDEAMDEVLMSSVVEACVRIGQPDLLTGKLQQLQDTNKLVVNSSHTFGSLIKAYGHAHDLDSIWRCWKDMRSRHIKPTSITLGCMIEALVNNGCTEDGFDLVQQLQGDSQCQDVVNAIIYCSILKGFAREKRLPRVLAVYEEMSKKKFELSLVTFNTVIDGCVRVGRMEDAAKILAQMKEFHVDPNIITYSTMLKGHCQAGNIELGFSTLHQMQRETKLKPDEIMYNSLLDGCAQNALYAEGMELYAEMLAAGIPPSNFTLSILVKLCNRSRKVNEGFSIVEDIKQKYGIKPNAHVYTNLIQACVSNRRHVWALPVVETMLKERIALDSRVYGILIRASIFQGQHQQAAGFLRAALGLTGALEILAGSPYAVCSSLEHNLVNDTLSRLADAGCMDSIVAPLLAELKTSKHKVQIDAALQRRVTEAQVGNMQRKMAVTSAPWKK